MNGAESLLSTLEANGVDRCFMNPGTSEMRFVAALDRVKAVRGILCLCEGVCAGAADGYARMKGAPAATLLHLGPGLANALSNLHNARKARSPVINIVGEHSTRHMQYDAPLSADIEAFARTVSGHIRVVNRAPDMGAAASETIAAAMAPPGQVATLIVPADVSWSEAGGSGAVVPRPRRQLPSGETISGAAKLLPLEGTGILLGGTTINDRALAAAGRIAARTGARIFADRNAARIASGRGRFHPQTVPYFPEPAIALLSTVRHLILVETQAPVSFFGYPNTPSYLLPEECVVPVLANRSEDGTGALEALVEECGASACAIPQDAPQPAAPPPQGPLTLAGLGAILAACLPDDCILSDEMVSAGATIVPHLLHAARHDRLPVTGGSIGQGLPVAMGAAFACPERKVVALEADGSGMYTLQSLWTMARENLDVLTVILANRRYQILEIEMRRVGVGDLSDSIRDSIDIGRPCLDWVRLSEGMGVPATRACSTGEFERQLRDGLAVRGPRLIEAVLTEG